MTKEILKALCEVTIGSCFHIWRKVIKGLILGIGGTFCFGKAGQKPFQFLLTRKMRRKLLKEIRNIA